jgi:mono/diheme cytochrome c family protein
MAKKSLVLLSTFLLGSFVALGQDQSKPAQNTAPAAQATAPNAQGSAPAQSKIPDEALKQPNPVKPTAESIASGKRMYGYDCAMCHGDSGNGKGDLAADMKLQLADFSDPKSLQGKTDGELFYVIKNGKGQMPAEGTRAKPDQIWNMVNYIRSLAKSAKPEKAETPTKTP